MKVANGTNRLLSPHQGLPATRAQVREKQPEQIIANTDWPLYNLLHRYCVLLLIRIFPLKYPVRLKNITFDGVAVT
jgi:hypothetical protein